MAAVKQSPPPVEEKRKLGELVIVVLRARHLTNVKIAKQDPYCTLTIHPEKQRTSVIKKGGQHPTWDEQVKFDIVEDTEDALARPAEESPGDTPGGPEAKSPGKRKRKVFEKGSKVVRLSCFADAPREPELIGEAVFDLAKVLNTGEDEEWITINRKDRYAGEIFLEFTYFIAGTPPPPKPPKLPVPGQFEPARQYGHIRHASSASNLYSMAEGMPMGSPEDDRRRAGSFSNQTSRPVVQPPLKQPFSHSASLQTLSQYSRTQSLDVFPRPASMMSLASSASSTSTIASRPLPSLASSLHSRVDSGTSTQSGYYAQPPPPSSYASQPPSAVLHASTSYPHGFVPQTNPIYQYAHPPLQPSSTPMPPSSSYSHLPPALEYAPYPSATPVPTLPASQPYGAPYQMYQPAQHPPPMAPHSFSDPQQYYAHPPPSQTPLPPPTPMSLYHSSSTGSIPAGEDAGFAAGLVPHRRPDTTEGGRPLPDPAGQNRFSSSSYGDYGHQQSSPSPYGYPPSQGNYYDRPQQQQLPPASYSVGSTPAPVDPTTAAAPPPPPPPPPPIPQQTNPVSQWPTQQPAFLQQGNIYEAPSNQAPTSTYYQSPYPPSAPTPAPPPPEQYRQSSPSYPITPAPPPEQYRQPSPSYQPVGYPPSSPSHPAYLHHPSPSQETYQRQPSPSHGPPPPPPPPPPVQAQANWSYAGQQQQQQQQVGTYPVSGEMVPPGQAGGYSGWQMNQQTHWG